MSFIEKQNFDKKYYYCTKTTCFPLNDVILSIYNLYESQNLKEIEFNVIYEHLKNSFCVKSFNRQNLFELLNSTGKVNFSTIRDLYIKNILMNTEYKIYNLELLENLFIYNTQKTKDIIASLGVDSLVDIINKGDKLVDYLKNIDSCINKNSNNEITNDKTINLTLDSNNAEMLIELFQKHSDNGWNKIMLDEKLLKDIISMFVLNKKDEEKKLGLKYSILFLLNLISDDNNNARMRYLLPNQVSSILEKQNICKIADLHSISNKTAIECYSFADDILELLIKLDTSIPINLNEKYKYLLQLANKDNKPNSLWENYVYILERRAENLTLDKIGKSIGLSKQRIRQVETKYLDNFSKFLHCQNENIINSIRSFCENPLFLTNVDINNLFSFNPKVFKYLLQNVEIDELSYIEELDKFYFVDDYDWYKEIIEYVENMPEHLDKIQFDDHVNGIIKILSNNGVELDYTDCKTIITQFYKLIGTVYSKNRLTLTERFKNILKLYYPNPFSIYDENFIIDFRNHYNEVYNDDKIKTNRSVTSIISRIGMLAGRGKYILNDRYFMSKELSDKIYRYIIDSDRNIFLTNNLFSIFEDELVAEGIDNKYFMQGALKQRIGDKLYFRRDYISTSKEVTSIYGEIYNFIKNSKRVITYDELQNEFVGTPNSVLIIAISQEGILNYRAKYVHIDNIHIDDEDKKHLKEYIISFIADNNIHHINDLMAYIKLTNIDILNKLMIEDYFGLFSVLEYLFEDQFEFKRPFIAKNGIKIENQADRLKEFVNSEDVLSIDSFIDFAYSNKLHFYSIVEFVDGLENYIFKDNDTLIKLNKTNLNKYNTEIVEQMIIKAMKPDEFILADKLNFYNIMPKEVNWTPWLLYSALNKFGQTLKAIPSDSKFKMGKKYIARPIILYKNMPVKSFNELIQYLKDKNNLNDIELYKYLRSKELT